MYLINLLFQGIISILLLVFIITLVIGLYYYFNNSAKSYEDDSKFNEKAEQQTSEDKQTNEEILVSETDFSGTNFIETSIQIEKLAQTNSAILENIVEEQVQSSPESQSNSDNKVEIYDFKSSNRRSKKKSV